MEGRGRRVNYAGVKIIVKVERGTCRKRFIIFLFSIILMQKGKGRNEGAYLRVCVYELWNVRVLYNGNSRRAHTPTHTQLHTGSKQ